MTNKAFSEKDKKAINEAGLVSDTQSPLAPELTKEFYEQLFDEYKKEHDLMPPFWQQCQKLYEAYFPRIDYKKPITALQAPTVKGLVGVVQKAGRIIAELNSMEHIIGVEPLYVGDVDLNLLQKRADYLQELLEYLLGLGKFKTSVLPKAILDAAIFPSTFLAAGWQVEYQVDENGEYIPRAEYPVAKRISPFRAVFDTSAEDIQSGRYFHEIVYIPLERLEIQVKRSNLSVEAFNKIKQAYRSSPDDFYRTEIKSEKKERAGANTNYIRIINSYKYFDAEGDGPSLYLVSWEEQTKEVLSSKKRLNNHGQIPVVAASMMLNPETITGLSPLMQAYYPLQEYKHFRNVASLNLNLAGALTLLVSDAANLKTEALRNKQYGTVIRGSNVTPEHVRQMQLDPMLNAILPFLQLHEYEIQSILGHTDLTLGIKSPETARGAQILAAQAYTNQDISLQMFILTGLFPLYQMFLSDVQQFLSQDVYLRLEKKFVKIGPQDIVGNFVPTVGTLLTQAKQKSIAEALQTLMAMAGQSGLQLPYDKLFRLILKGYGLPRQIIDDIIPEPDQIPANKLKAMKGLRGDNQPMGMPPAPEGGMPDMASAILGSAQPAQPMPGGQAPLPTGEKQLPPELLQQLAEQGITPEMAQQAPIDQLAMANQIGAAEEQAPAAMPGLPPELANLTPEQLQALLALRGQMPKGV